MLTTSGHARCLFEDRIHQSPCGRGAWFAEALSSTRTVQTRYVHTGVGGMIVEPGFLDHWKVQLLIRRTEDPASPLMILRLWGHCQRMRNSELRITPEGLACLCHWDKKPDELLSLLISLRFLDERDGFLKVHDFDAHNGKLVSCWNNGSKGGRTKKRKTQPRLGFCERNPSAVSEKPTPSSLSNLSGLKEGVRGRFEEWMKVRRGMGKKPSNWDTLFSKQISWLLQFNETDQNEILDQSMRNGWQGLFVPGKNGQGKNNGFQRSMSAFEIKKRQDAITEEINRIFKRNGSKRIEGDGIDDLKKHRTELQHQLIA